MLMTGVSILISSFVLINAEQNWSNLKTTWDFIPVDGFKDQPRTVAEAQDAGWISAGNFCGNENSK